MSKNWLVTDKGDLINLDFFSKILWGGYFTPTNTKAKETTVYLFHGSSGQSASIAYKYASADEALIAYREFMVVLHSIGISTDMRGGLDQSNQIESLRGMNPATMPVSVPIDVVLTGITLNPFAAVTSSGGTFSSLMRQNDGSILATFTPGAVDGTFEIVYTSAGLTNTLANYITITP